VRVVREDGSGTTDSFMKYLKVIFNKPVLGTETWSQLGEKTQNTIWPNEAGHPVVRGNGGGGVVKKVQETIGGIGYANVSDARANAAFVPPLAEPKRPRSGVRSNAILSKKAVKASPSTQTPRPTAMLQQKAAPPAVKPSTRTERKNSRRRRPKNCGTK
jgi:ABC-type phosphate transport system substrate-binding protein